MIDDVRYNDTGCLVAMRTRMQQIGCHDNHYMNFLVVILTKIQWYGSHGNHSKRFLVAMATSLYSHMFGSTYIVQLTISVVHLLHLVACNHKHNT